MKETTQVYIRDGERYLMLHRVKKKNDMNEGKWIAAGGKLEPGETPEECAFREVLEETGLRCLAMEKKAEIEFINDVYEDELMHIYICDSFEKVTEPVSDEGVFQWIERKDLPALNLWEGDRVFLPRVLSGEKYFTMRLVYSGDRLLRVE